MGCTFSIERIVRGARDVGDEGSGDRREERVPTRGGREERMEEAVTKDAKHLNPSSRPP